MDYHSFQIQPSQAKTSQIMHSSHLPTLKITHTQFKKTFQTLIEDCSWLDCIELYEDKDPIRLSSCKIKGLLKPDLLVFEVCSFLIFCRVLKLLKPASSHYICFHFCCCVNISAVVFIMWCQPLLLISNGPSIVSTIVF